MYRVKKDNTMGPLQGIENNYNFLQFTGGARRIGGINYTQETGGINTGSASGNMPSVDLQNKTGTSNQSVILPGGVQTFVANRLDYCI